MYNVTEIKRKYDGKTSVDTYAIWEKSVRIAIYEMQDKQVTVIQKKSLISKCL